MTDFMKDQPQKQSLPSIESAKIQNLIHQEMLSLGFSGPIPPPQMLEAYNKILPGAAERILNMAEKQSAHRQNMEKTIVLSDTRNSHLGLVFAFILVFTSISAGTFLTYIGKEGTGLTTIIGAITSVVAIFIYRKRIQKKNSNSNSLIQNGT